MKTNTNGFSLPTPGAPEFIDKLEERRYLKARLAAAFRIFAKYGFDEGAGMSPVGPPVPTVDRSPPCSWSHYRPRPGRPSEFLGQPVRHALLTDKRL